MAYPETLPCQCINPACGISFEVPNFIGNIGSNSLVSGCKVDCPRCKSSARLLDFSTDSTGKAHYQQLFNFVRSINDAESLGRIKEELEAANDSVMAKELAENLANIDPGFSRFKLLIESSPAKVLPILINLLLTTILVVLAYQDIVASNENHDESIEVQRKQLELNREQFEHQKERGSLKDSQIDDLEKEIRELEERFEREINSQGLTQLPRKPVQNGIKGCERNKPCPCGSGLKYKKCHPNAIFA